jgi:hypothetical protein
LVTDWPGEYVNIPSGKVPNKIAYGPKFEGGFEWGYKITPLTKCEAWTKLLLDKKETSKLALEFLIGRNDDDDDDGRSLPYQGKAPVEIIGDFFSGVKKHLDDSLENSYGPILLSLLEREVIIIVPAVCSDKAKHLIYQAVRMAGLGSIISMIEAPEAAAICTLREMSEGTFSHIRVGFTITVTFGKPRLHFQ